MRISNTLEKEIEIEVLIGYHTTKSINNPWINSPPNESSILFCNSIITILINVLHITRFEICTTYTTL